MKSRSAKLSIRVTDKEQTEVVELAHALSMSVSNYGRKRLLAEPIKQMIIPPVNLQAYQEIVNLKNELRAIGQNLNQVVKFMHSCQTVTPSLVDTIDDTNCQITQATKLLNHLLLMTVGAKD